MGAGGGVAVLGLAWGVGVGTLCGQGVFCERGGFCGRSVFSVLFGAFLGVVFGVKHASCEPNSGKNPTRCPSCSRIQNSPIGVLQGWESMGRCGFCSIAWRGIALLGIDWNLGIVGSGIIFMSRVASEAVICALEKKGGGA